jgi:tRNA (cmo5U34)-methyltransferase
MTSKNIKSVGDNLSSSSAGWKFSGKVAEAFTEHAGRSIPLYNQGHELILKTAEFFLQKDSLCYDIGISNGRLLGLLCEYFSGKGIRWVGIDSEPDMVEASRLHLLKYNEHEHIELLNGDVMELEFASCDLIICYYTLQFIAPRNRQILLDRMYKALNWGGALILCEKVRGPDARFQDILTSLYTDYKLDQGYSESEIIHKSRSLKGVLEPFSTQGNLDLLKRAGFVDVMTLMKYICFEGFLAIK